MTQIPQGARRSDDGHYWWDEVAGEWKLVEQGEPAAGAAAGDAAGVAGSAGATVPGDPRVEARVAAGIPAERHAATDEQRAQYIGESTIGHESLAYTVLDVPEIKDESA